MRFRFTTSYLQSYGIFARILRRLGVDRQKLEWNIQGILGRGDFIAGGVNVLEIHFIW